MAIGVLRELEALRERKRQRRRGWWVSAFRRQPLSGLPWLGVTAFGFGSGYVMPEGRRFATFSVPHTRGAE